MSETLDDIFDDYKEHAGWARLYSSNPTRTRDEATLKQAILQWVNDEVIGKTEKANIHEQPQDKWLETTGRNQLRTNQRDILKQHGWKEPK